MTEELKVFMCGPPKDHECNFNGPTVLGGNDSEGNFWIGPDTPENRSRASWGSVSCSLCGITAYETSQWF